jgi:hypothetical protein
LPWIPATEAFALAASALVDSFTSDDGARLNPVSSRLDDTIRRVNAPYGAAFATMGLEESPMPETVHSLQIQLTQSADPVRSYFARSRHDAATVQRAIEAALHGARLLLPACVPDDLQATSVDLGGRASSELTIRTHVLDAFVDAHLAFRRSVEARPQEWPTTVDALTERALLRNAREMLYQLDIYLPDLDNYEARQSVYTASFLEAQATCLGLGGRPPRPEEALLRLIYALTDVQPEPARLEQTPSVEEAARVWEALQVHIQTYRASDLSARPARPDVENLVAEVRSILQQHRERMDQQSSSSPGV